AAASAPCPAAPTDSPERAPDNAPAILIPVPQPIPRTCPEACPPLRAPAAISPAVRHREDRTGRPCFQIATLARRAAARPAFDPSSPAAIAWTVRSGRYRSASERAGNGRV